MRLVELARRRYQIDGFAGVIKSIPAFVTKPIRLRISKARLRYRNDAIVERDGVLLDLSQEVISDSKAILLGHYEADEVSLIRQYLPPETDVIELGAGIGYVSCVIQSIINKNMTHIAVEANERLLPVLERHKALNEAAIQINHGAYAVDASEVQFASEEYLTGSVTSENRATRTVSAVQLDDLCEAYDIGRFSLVADIEGAETELFDHELELLESKCQYIIIEFHPDVDGYDRIRERLRHSAFEHIDERWNVAVYRNRNHCQPP